MFRPAEDDDLVEKDVGRRDGDRESVLAGRGPALLEQAQSRVDVRGVSRVIQTAGGQRLLELENKISNGFNGGHGADWIWADCTPNR